MWCAAPPLSTPVACAIRRLCQPGASIEGGCTFPSEVTLDANLECHADECAVDTVRVVKISNGDEDVFYEYVPAACVHLAFYDNPVVIKRKWGNVICANPLATLAGSGCCSASNLNDGTADGVCKYVGERTTFATAEARCAAEGMALCGVHFWRSNSPCRYDNLHIWSRASCSVQLQVATNGDVNIVHASRSTGSARTFKLDSGNLFRVPWREGFYPRATDGCSMNATSCVTHGFGCLCNFTVASSAVFDDVPTLDEIEARLHIGSASPQTFDLGTHVLCTTAACTAAVGFETYLHASSGVIDGATIFKTSRFGRDVHLANRESVVQIEQYPNLDASSRANFSFRNVFAAGL